MYQEVLDALNEDKTTRQHINKLNKLYDKATDLNLKKLIGAVSYEYVQWLAKLKKFANQKTYSTFSKQKNVAKAQAARSKTFIPSKSIEDGKVLLSVSALIAYCNSMI
ncbi:hypothetical protein [Serratia liquefaciens]|uniref:hypothetical protein n=1 Tax=Serratia liquefaciens TaxID=614 RepID=UPI003B43D605